jgi:hypothetical protein
MKKYFLSSMLVMGLMTPVFGADGIITGGAGTCTVDVLGVSDNNATANTIATWALNDYKCGAGQYLDEDTLACITCPTGSYCPGGTYTVENADEGTNACPTGYKNSDAGASSNTQCYTNCKVSDIAHATAVTGNDYYGTGTDTCAATDCELGYHKISKMTISEAAMLASTIIGAEATMDDINNIRNNWDELYSSLSVEQINALKTPLGLAQHVEPEPSSPLEPFVVLYERLMDEIPQKGMTYANGYMYTKDFDGTERCYALSGVMILFFLAPMKISIDCDVAEQENADLAEFRATAQNGEWFLTMPNKHIAVSGRSTCDYSYGIPCRATYKTVNGIAVPENWGEASDMNWTEESGYCPTGCLAETISFTILDDVTYCSAKFAGYTINKAIDCSNLTGFNTGLRKNMAQNIDMPEELVFGGMCKITENNCPAGQYLAVVGDAMMCVPCKSGSYCPGGVYTIESEYKGTNVCPTTHPNSDAGAGADTQCYTACTLETANIAHATAVSGNDYYGAGTDTCSATECVKGYHTDGRMQFVEKTPAVNVDFDTINGVAVIDGTGWTFNENLPNSGLTENNTIAVSFLNGIMYGRASCQPSMDTGIEYMMNNMNAVMDGSMSVEDFRFGMTAIAGAAKAKFAVEYVNALKSGNMTEEESAEWEMKLTAVFLANKNANYTTSSAGKYCYFQVNGFAPSGGTKSDIVGLPWMLFPEPFESADECASNCIMSGAESVLQLASVALGALDYVDVAICAANTINIDWNPDNGRAHTQNMCTYDGAITLPDDPVKPGFTFAGWKLVE